MKNREEYQASIFKKRDALLAKRRKKISQAAAVMSVCVCFAVAFAFLPKKFGQKLSSEVFPVITDSTVYVAETYVEDFNEYYSFTSSYTPAKTDLLAKRKIKTAPRQPPLQQKEPSMIWV